MKKKIIFILILLIILITLSLLDRDNIPYNKNMSEIDEVIDKTSIKENDNIDINEIEDEKETYKNPDIIGYINIDGTSISEYIAKTTDNDYYLNHNLNKEYDISGAVFMDYRNSINDKKLLIFGHNGRKLKTVPFHDLEKYLNRSFYDDNKYIDLKLGNLKGKWIIFSVMIVDKNSNTHMKLKFDDIEWINHIEWLTENSVYDTGVNVTVNDRILILQTCNYNPEGTYILISAKEVT